MRKTKVKNTEGITLVALVVTIVILLILAGVSIQLTLGNNGIIRKAQDAKLASEVADEKDVIVLAYNSAFLEVRGKDISTDLFQREMNDVAGVNKTVVTKKVYPEGFDILFNDTNRKYEIINGVVNEINGDSITLPDMSYIFNFDRTTGTILGIKKEYMSKDSKGKYMYYNHPIAGPEYIYDNGYGGCLLENDIDTLVIPNKIEGIAVKNVGYVGAANVRRIVVEEGIEKIEKIYNNSYGHFDDNIIKNNLEEVILPSSVTSIGDYILAGCETLKNINISEGITSIGQYAFSGCSSLTNITIPSTVTSIGYSAFWNCTGLKTINIQKPTNKITGSPWGASSTTNIVWNYR